MANWYIGIFLVDVIHAVVKLHATFEVGWDITNVSFREKSTYR